MAGFSTTSGGLNFQYPNRDTVNWDAVMANTFTTISSHDHDRDTAGRGAVLTDRSLLAANTGWLQSSDFAGTGTVNLIRASATDEVELGAALALLTVTGLSSLASVTASGTLGVTGLTTLGAATVGSTLGVTGHATLSTASTSGLATLASASVTTTLGVTGHATLSTASTSGLMAMNSATVTTTLDVTGELTTGDITFPTVDGTAGQVLATDAAGNIDFINSSKVLQTATVIDSTKISTTSIIPADTTIPQNTEGVEVITLAITPKSSTSKLVIQFSTPYNDTTSVLPSGVISALFVDSTVDALSATLTSASPGGDSSVFHGSTLTQVVASGSTAARTYKIRQGIGVAGTCYINQLDNGVYVFGGVESTTLTITEVEV